MSGMAQGARELPPGWVRQWDMTRQAFFYINSNVQPPSVQWEPPACPVPASSGASAPTVGSAGGMSRVLSWLTGGSSAVSPHVTSTALVPVSGSDPNGLTVGGDLAPPSRLLSNAVVGAAGSLYSIGQLLVFLVEMVLRILIKTCTPLLTGALKSMMEAQSQTNYITHDAVSTSKRDSTVKWWGAGLGGLLRAAPRGGVRPGFEKGLETGRYIIICGGKRDSDNATVPHTQIYDRMSGHWEPGPDMLRPRVSARAVVLHGELYVVGGWDGRAVLQSVERLDVSIGRFVRVSDMNIARASPALAVLDGFLYAIGGFDGNDWLRDVERYDPGKDAWQVVAPLSAPRSAFGSCAINGSILAIGGSDGHMSQRTVERYNPQTNRWTSMPGLTTRRENLGVAVFDDQVPASLFFAPASPSAPLSTRPKTLCCSHARLIRTMSRPGVCSGRIRQHVGRVAVQVLSRRALADLEFAQPACVCR